MGLGLATVLCVGLELLRELHFGDQGFHFLLWNLFLAWIPLLLALAIYDGYRRRGAAVRQLALAVLWLLFLPNAPYIFTDFIHLSPASSTPLWLDGAILSAFAWTGVLLGFVSLYLVHAVARHRYGHRIGWAGALGVLALTSAGVCLGRFLRWNSWDLIVRPGQRLAQVAARLGDPSAVVRASALTLLLTGLLMASYCAFYALVGLRLEPERRRRR